MYLYVYTCVFTYICMYTNRLDIECSWSWLEVFVQPCLHMLADIFHHAEGPDLVLLPVEG